MEKTISHVRELLVKEDALYITGKVQGIEVEWLLDTGCSLSIISAEVYQRIPEECRPKLEKNPVPMRTADGSTLADLGVVQMKVWIDQQEIEHEFVVASLTNEGILGTDFLRIHRGNIDFAKNKFYMNGQLMLTRNGTMDKRCNRISVATMSAPTNPDQQSGLVLCTSVQGDTIEAVLTRVGDNAEEMLACGCRSLTGKEMKYCLVKRELLAVVYFIGKYRHWWGGQRFEVKTNPDILRYVMSQRKPQGQMLRWIEVLTTHDFGVKPREESQDEDGVLTRTREHSTEVSRGHSTKEVSRGHSTQDVKETSEVDDKLAHSMTVETQVENLTKNQ